MKIKLEARTPQGLQRIFCNNLSKDWALKKTPQAFTSCMICIDQSSFDPLYKPQNVFF